MFLVKIIRLVSAELTIRTCINIVEDVMFLM